MSQSLLCTILDKNFTECSLLHYEIFSHGKDRKKIKNYEPCNCTFIVARE